MNIMRPVYAFRLFRMYREQCKYGGSHLPLLTSIERAWLVSSGTK